MFDRILVVTLSNIGDAAMTTPVFETLHQLYPSSVIDIVGDERSSGIFLGAPYLGVTYHRRKKASLWENMRLVGRLRRQKYDLIVDLRTNLIPILLRGKRRFYKRSRSGVSQHSVEEHMSAILSLLNKEFKTPPCKIYIDKEEARKARAAVSTIPQGRWLAVAPGANWPGKKWAAARYRELIFKLDGQFDAVLLLGIEGDSLEEIETSMTPIFDFTGKTNLSLVKVLLSKSSFFIGNDSGLGHLAASLSVPTLTLFGPGNPDRYKPISMTSSVLVAPENDLGKLTPDVVFEAMLPHLKKGR